MRCVISVNGIAGIEDTVLYVKYIKHDPADKHGKDHKENYFHTKLFLISDQFTLISGQYGIVSPVPHGIQKNQKDK